ncbi:MAG: hypothetical protein Q7S53_00600 [bacterium]|nr:hypothetical protein [bacterium]
MHKMIWAAVILLVSGALVGIVGRFLGVHFDSRLGGILFIIIAYVAGAIAVKTIERIS